MDLIFASLFTALFLMVFTLFHFFPLAGRDWVNRKWPVFSQRILVAFLSGFVLFVILTHRIPRWPQKIMLLAVSIILIFTSAIPWPGHKEQ